MKLMKNGLKGKPINSILPSQIIYRKVFNMNCAIYVRVSTHAQGIKLIESFLMGQKCPYTQLKNLREHFITQVIQNAIRTIL